MKPKPKGTFPGRKAGERAASQVGDQMGRRAYEWKRLGHKGGFGFVTPDGEPILAARVRAGLFRSGGDIEVDASLPEQAALRAGLLAAYMLIQRNDDIAASSAGASVATTS